MNEPTPTGAEVPKQNTDRELFREREGDYYADSIHVTKEGAIGINCGGSVRVMPLKEWHHCATLLRENEELTRERDDADRRAGAAERTLEYYKEEALSNKTELTHLRERVKELEADGERLNELMWRNDIMVKVFRGGIVVVLKPYGTPSFPLRAAIDAALKGDGE